MTTISDDARNTLEHEVQQLLGRCLLRLQEYERLIKFVVAHHEISESVHTLGSGISKQIADTSGKTLGILVRDLLGTSIVSQKNSEPDKEMVGFIEDVTSVSMQSSLILPDADFARLEKELKELVLLRNNLVHHFIDLHDLGSLDGCRGAQGALVAASKTIDQHLEQLREQVECMANTRRTLAEFTKSDVFRELISNVIPLDGIESALREATRELAVDGWAPVAEAGRWVVEQHPEQLPAKYGCKSWRHVVHKSHIFELRYRVIDGKRAAWYREKKECSANSR